MIYTVTLNPALDKTAEISNFCVDAVNRMDRMRTDPGGKGINVSKVIAALGGTSLAVGILGGATGRRICDAAKALSLETDFVFTDGETRTNLKIVDPDRHTCTDINEPGAPVSARVLDELRCRLAGRLKPGAIVVLAGSLPTGAPASTYRVFAQEFAAAGAKVFLDADGDALREGVLASPYLIKPNVRELSALAGRELGTRTELEQAAREQMSRNHIEKAVVSMGKDGLLYLTAQETLCAKAVQVPVRSTVGAGDSLVGALAVAEEAGLDTRKTARLLAAVGAANVMCTGTQAASLETVRALLPQVIVHSHRALEPQGRTSPL